MTNYTDHHYDTIYKPSNFRPWSCDGEYQIPTLKTEYHIPHSLISFDDIKNSRQSLDSGVHFYIDDHRFKRLWRNPDRYLEMLKKFDCVLTPNFSLFSDMPVAMKIWNTYRSRLIGQMMQDHGIRVIPSVTWAEPESYQYCFFRYCKTRSNKHRVGRNHEKKSEYS